MTVEGFPVRSESEADTEAAGRVLAELLGPGTIVALYGDLGAGKTRLVKGIVEALGGDAKRVSSPTFTIVQEYETPAATVYHVDAYRIRQAREFDELGIEDILYGDGIVLIEWPDLLEPLPEGTLRISIRHLGADDREIELRHAG